MTDPHDIPEDARRYWLLVAIYERLQASDELVNALPNGADDIVPGDPLDVWEGSDSEALLVFRPFSGDTRTVIGGEIPDYDIQVVLEWSFEHDDTSRTFWDVHVFDAVDDALSQFSPGQFTGLGSSGGIDTQPDDDRNRYVADAVYGFRTTIDD